LEDGFLKGRGRSTAKTPRTPREEKRREARKGELKREKE
jgi:hypothetical protein